ncbi:MAG: AbrB/MazE/SpoVT family DNA-binding domain-containing protein [Candidatus Angelobacter sp.]
MAVLKLKISGDSTVVEIPPEMLDRLRVSAGDELFAIETPVGYVLITHDPDLKEELRFGREFMSRYRETFKALAK